MRSRNTVATLFPNNVKPGILSSMNIGADRSISSEEKALIEQMQADADIEALFKSYQALSQDVQSAAGAEALVTAAARVRQPNTDVDAIHALYAYMCHHGPSPTEGVYAVLTDLLCQRDHELYGRPGSYAEYPDYFGLALQVTTDAYGAKKLPSSTTLFNQLLRCCIPRGAIDKAVSVLSLMESCFCVIKDTDTYCLLLQVFMSDAVPTLSGHSFEDRQKHCLEACLQIFRAFEDVVSMVSRKDARPDECSLERCADVWATMIDAYFVLGDVFGAVALFERMIAESTKEPSVPAIDEQIVSHMVMGFVHVGDARAAIEWLYHLDASHMPAPSSEALECAVSGAIQTPSTDAALLMRDVGRILIARDAPTTGLHTAASRCVTNLASVLEMRKVERSLNASDIRSCYEVLEKLARLLFCSHDADHPLASRQQTAPVSAILRLAAHNSMHGYAERAGQLFQLSTLALRHSDASSPAVVSLMCDACHLPMAIADAAASAPHVLSGSCVRLIALSSLVLPAMAGLSGSLVGTTNTAVVRQYEAASRDLHGDLAPLDLDEAAWKRIVDVFCSVEKSSPSTYPGPDGYTGLGKLLAELSRLPRPPNLDLELIKSMLEAKYGPDGAIITQGWLSNSTAESSSAPRRASSPSSPTPPKGPLSQPAKPMEALFLEGRLSPHLPPVKSIDQVLTQAIQSLARPHNQEEHATDLYDRLKDNIQHGQYPTPSSLAVLINAFGRSAQVDQINELYDMALHVLASKPSDEHWRTQQWTQLEDGMITALSHAMLGQRANAHRLRMISANQVPSASAYAALIATIQERTDDAIVAEELFNESQRLGVRPTTYLFNTIISKLSRARKVEQALRLFDTMQTSNLRPSSVTYGAAINACVRTGDEARATQLFAEMEAQPMFQPRVPPYNTMIQYYVHSVMNRDKALHYYEKMQQAGVRPSAHTYKLLLDAWGTIEPVQPDRQQAVFARLSADRLVGVQGTHWASLIHTQGVVLHDLERAMETFESIANRAPRIPRGNAPLSTVPDAVVFEALFAVFVAHGRTDLMPTYLARMVSQGIWPTAYIANLLIKGYAQDGPMGLVEARRVFDAMIDPPAGIAAAGNHLPRHHGAGALGIRRERLPAHSSRQEHAPDRANVLGALVNREPSTYEAMIRAELAYGHTDRAQAILTRMKARAFPAALLNRVQAMFDRT